MADTKSTDPNRLHARKTGLRYVSAAMPGIKRVKKGSGFSYLDADGGPVKDEATLQRIKSLVIPPAWRDVRICPHETGHLQATGLDVKGRKQYRYHPEWNKSRNSSKFGRMQAFADRLPVIRKAVEADLGLRGIPKQKVVATVVGLLDKAFLRIGNTEYTKSNKSYGLTTLRDRHVEIKGDTIRFEFIGKKGVAQAVKLEDARLARIVKKCKDIPGFDLFQYFDDKGERHCIESGDINEWLQETAGEAFTSKDFRTWAGTVQAFRFLRGLEHTTDEKVSKKNMVDVVKLVAGKLGNTTAVCRKYYIHPEVLEAFADGRLHRFIAACENVRARKYFSVEECMLVRFLEEKV